MMNMARQTMNDHHFTGNVKKDFGLTRLDMLMPMPDSEMEDKFLDEEHQLHVVEEGTKGRKLKDDEENSTLSMDTGLTTVQMGNHGSYGAGKVGEGKPRPRAGPREEDNEDEGGSLPLSAATVDGSSTASDLASLNLSHDDDIEEDARKDERRTDNDDPDENNINDNDEESGCSDDYSCSFCDSSQASQYHLLGHHHDGPCRHNHSRRHRKHAKKKNKSAARQKQTTSPMDITSLRLWIFVGLIFAGFSMLGSALFWLVFPSVLESTNNHSRANNNPSSSPSNNGHNFQGTVLGGGRNSSPTPSPTKSDRDNKDKNVSSSSSSTHSSPADLFLETGEPNVPACPDGTAITATSSSSKALPGKKGLALRADATDGRLDLSRLLALDPYWNHVWGPTRPRNQPSLIEFVPMLLPSSSVQASLNAVQAWQDMAALVDSEETRTHPLFGFYKPDLVPVSASSSTAATTRTGGSSTNMATISVESAIEQWSALEGQVASLSSAVLSSPVAANPTGSWMRDFMAKVEERCLRLDWISVVWYGSTSVRDFQSTMQHIHSLYGGRRPLVLTEFAAMTSSSSTSSTLSSTARNNDETIPASQAEVLSFLQQVLPWIEAQDWIVGYAWSTDLKPASAAGTSSTSIYSRSAAELFDVTGQLTTVGRYYASVRSDQPQGDLSITV